MLDLYHLPASANVQVFTCNNAQTDPPTASMLWNKPRGKVMAYMICIAAGGKGGNGTVGALGAAAGGGGGGSGGQSTLLIPLSFLPDTLNVSVNNWGWGSIIWTGSVQNANSTVLMAGGGNDGGNASAGTAGAAGGAAAAGTIAQCCLAGVGVYRFIAGQAGIIGGTTVAGADNTMPVTGLRAMGGGGGGGLPASAIAGTVGGRMTPVGAPTPFPNIPAASGGSATTTPPQGGCGLKGSIGKDFLFNYGGSGSGSTHGGATGAGLVQAQGGCGGYGSGGGGNGGALTGSTAQTIGGLPGEGIAIIICW